MDRKLHRLLQPNFAEVEVAKSGPSQPNTTTSFTVPIPAQITGDRSASVSLEIESSRSRNYNKVAVKVRAFRPCAVGAEDQEAKYLIGLVQPIIDDYMDMANQKLTDWAQ